MAKTDQVDPAPAPEPKPREPKRRRIQEKGALYWVCPVSGKRYHVDVRECDSCRRIDEDFVEVKA